MSLKSQWQISCTSPWVSQLSGSPEKLAVKTLDYCSSKSEGWFSALSSNMDHFRCSLLAVTHSPLLVYLLKCSFVVGCLIFKKLFWRGSLLLDELMRKQQAPRCSTLHSDRLSRLVVGSGSFCSPPHCFSRKLVFLPCLSVLITFKSTSIFVLTLLIDFAKTA